MNLHDKAQVLRKLHHQPQPLVFVNVWDGASARIVESLTALLIAVNGRYKTHAGISLTGLPDTLW